MTPPPPERLYRYFATEAFAEAFVQGHIWVTTIEECRRYEDAHRGDPDEGTRHRISGTIGGHGDDPEFRAQAAKLGMTIHEGARDIVISRHRNIEMAPNAWLLCASLVDDPMAMREFGEFCVKIIQPVQFAERVARSISREVQLEGAYAGSVKYRSVEYLESDPEPGHLGFTKNPSYASQREFRMIWLPAGVPVIQPRVFECAEARSYLTRLR